MKKTPPAVRLFRRVTVAASGCWEWTGCTLPCGHGQILGASGKGEPAHRIAWEVFYGPVPPGHQLHHLCENKICVRPDHLALTTLAEHPTLHRRTHCANGHPFDEANTYVKPSDGRRRCRTCRTVGRREYRRRIAATRGTWKGVK